MFNKLFKKKSVVKSEKEVSEITDDNDKHLDEDVTNINQDNLKVFNNNEV